MEEKAFCLPSPSLSPFSFLYYGTESEIHNCVVSIQGDSCRDHCNSLIHVLSQTPLWPVGIPEGKKIRDEIMRLDIPSLESPCLASLLYADPDLSWGILTLWMVNQTAQFLFRQVLLNVASGRSQIHLILVNTDYQLDRIERGTWEISKVYYLVCPWEEFPEINGSDFESTGGFKIGIDS